MLIRDKRRAETAIRKWLRDNTSSTLEGNKGDFVWFNRSRFQAICMVGIFNFHIGMVDLTSRKIEIHLLGKLWEEIPQ